MKLTKAIMGCTAGAVISARFEAGEDCPDDLLAHALEQDALSEADAKKAEGIVAKQVEAAALPEPAVAETDPAEAAAEAEAETKA